MMKNNVEKFSDGKTDKKKTLKDKSLYKNMMRSNIENFSGGKTDNKKILSGKSQKISVMEKPTRLKKKKYLTIVYIKI